MVNTLILAAGEAATEGHHERVLYGVPTYWFGIAFGIAFLAMFLITISFSGRGVVRSHHAQNHLDADERHALNEYKGKYSHTR
ncbi:MULTISPECIES: hypothetical protein [unclassified Rothia (in: high G+C Gram-positive bacteria)]|uniref:hypothetical protein n=1 Tax=unclassified Rothia (in: high G+C Gram-positive bacteria) TaxID=2689056 RepID=UPI00195BE08A|nr:MULTISPECIES: hypothetical protein [unclassified Rothia (in: high G+C Gram-positive bacteria)]MBM7050437.1 hypothetical protein [Rothia sp. ZJ1223]QRZ62421.1 hypothetical protein JR346_04865 [Rothia sp. ZJ932]